LKRFDVNFGLGGKGTTDFIGQGYVTLYDTCLVVSGSVLRFRVPFLWYLVKNLLAVPTYRTIPYGAVYAYKAARSLRHRERYSLIKLLHRITYRLASGEHAAVVFTVTRRELSREFVATLNDRIAATKALYER
jgi:hypothetical protein